MRGKHPRENRRWQIKTKRKEGGQAEDNGVHLESYLSQKYCPSGALGSLRHSGWKLAGQRSQQMRVPPCEQRKHQLALTCIGFGAFDDDDEDAFDDFDLPDADAAVTANRAIGSLGSEVCYRGSVQR